MKAFNLKIITSDGVSFDGKAESVIVRTVAGDVSIWANHADFVTAIGIGRAQITIEGEKHFAACCGGVLSVLEGEATILAHTFEWRRDIDVDRANEALERTKKLLATAKDARTIELAKIKIQMALIRIDVKNNAK